jgi:hypothetical protein
MPTDTTTPPIDDDDQPWARQPGESSFWYSRLDIYLRLGPRRTLTAAYRKESEGKRRRKKPIRCAPGSWATVSAAWNWQARAEAFDAAQLAAINRVKDAEFRAALEAHHAESKEAARAVTEVGLQHLKKVQARLATVDVAEIAADALPAHLKAATAAVVAGVTVRSLFLGAGEVLKEMHRQELLDAKSAAKIRPPARHGPQLQPDAPVLRRVRPAAMPADNGDDSDGLTAEHRRWEQLLVKAFGTDEGRMADYLRRYATLPDAFRDLEKTLKRGGRP